jgi:signal transduction histidine kinase
VTAAAFPLVSGGISFGALVLFSDQEDFFERERVRFFQAYAHQAASALQNGRLYQRLQRELDERKRAEQDLQHLNEELEERVRQRTGQLEAANEELEAFSYSISHDLRTPLRGILSFSSDLLEAFADKISPDALRMLKSINSSSIHMEELIESLLTFSRYIRKTPQKTTVDMTALAQSVIDELAKLDSIPKVNIDLEPLPSVIGDPALLRQVFVNLISNALKYSRTKPEREIRIDSFSHNGEIVFVVADNGVGFDMTYADRLFGVFQRLHSSEEFEGTGVGLAIVQRIIHRHGGRVWAEGSVDHGAKFYFSLPRIEHS